MKLYAGIDGGIDGALVAIDENAQVVLQAICPVLPGKGTKRVFNEGAMRDLLRAVFNWTARGGGQAGSVLFGLENAQAMPQQGVTSMFTTGWGFGLWKGMLVMGNMRHETPRPQEWQKSLYPGVPGEGKTRSILAAQRLFPGLDLTPETVGPTGRKSRLRTPHDGLADASLIALYMLRKDRGQK